MKSATASFLSVPRRSARTTTVNLFTDLYAQVFSLLVDTMVVLMKHAKAKFVNFKEPAQQVIDLNT